MALRPASRRGRLVVVVDVRLAYVLALEVLMRHVRVMQRRVVMLMLACGAEVLEPPSHSDALPRSHTHRTRSPEPAGPDAGPGRVRCQSAHRIP